MAADRSLEDIRAERGRIQAQMCELEALIESPLIDAEVEPA